MSWTDEEIDNLFRDGATSQSFEYKDAYFTEIETALPVNNQRKDFLWMGTALLFIAVLTTGYFVSNTDDTSFDKNGQLANLESQASQKVSDTEFSIGENRNGDQSKLSDNTQTENITDKVSNEYASNKSNPTTSYYTEQQQKGWEHSMYNWATRNVGAKNVKTSSDRSVSEIDSQSAALENTENNGNEELRNELKSNFPSQFELEKSPITASLNVKGANQLDQNLNRDVTASLQMPYLGELRPKAGLYGEFNMGFSQSLITPSEVVSKSIGGGIGVETYLGNFNLSTGVNFKVSYHDDLFLTRKGKVYGFGSQEGKNEYDFQQIYSLELPITLGYNFGRHNMNIGVRPSVVIGGKMQLREFENNQLLRSSMKNGLVEGGLMRFGLKPTFGYGYRVNNWTIGVNIGVQIMESVNEEYISGFNNQFPIDGQFYLRRTIRLRR